MAAHFYPLTVRRVQPETADCVTVTFNVPDELKETFAFTQGQHLTIRANINGEEVRRNYSLCTGPNEGVWRVAIKKMEGGQLSRWANEELKKGMTLDVMPPTGRFYTPLHETHRKNYLAFAAGSGITPIISIIKGTLHAEHFSTFTLVFGNRNRNSIIFKEELEELKDKYIHRFRMLHVLSREKTETEINYGRLDALKCSQFAGKFINFSLIDDCFICGPEAMIFTIRDFLLEQGIAKERIHFELFNTSTAHKPIHKNDAAPSHKQPMAEVIIQMDGIESSFPLEYVGNSILDGALLQGADLPYACKGGVCCTCKAKLIEGKVDMDVVYGLEPDEIAAGYILTCQSHPRTPMVKVDYDG